MPSWLLLLAVAAVALVGVLVTTCNGAPTTTVTLRLDDAWRFVQPAMPVLVEVRGRPYPADPDAVEEMVTGAMTRAVTWHAQPRFTTKPASAAPSDMRIVVTFNPPRGAGGAGNCAGTIAGGAEDGSETVRVLATFCSGGRVLANVEGRVGKVGGEADGRVQALIRQITLDMFQSRTQP